MQTALWMEIALGQYLTGLLVFVRLGGVLFAAPLLSSHSVPVPVKVGLAAAVAVVLTPLLAPTAAPSLPWLVAALVKEALVGLVLGWAASLLLACVQMAGEWLDVQGGFQMAQLFNPLFQSGAGPLGNIKYLVAGLFFLHGGGLETLVRATAASLVSSPPGSLVFALGTVGDWSAMLTRTLWLSVQIAAPAGAALFLSEIALSIVNRALPQINVLMLSLPLKALLTVTALATALPGLHQTLTGAVDLLGRQLVGVVRLLAGG